MSAFRFTKKTDYGLLMLSMLYKSKGRYVSAMKMQDRGLPRSFLIKIAQELIDADIIGSKEGRGGGYYLKINPEKVTLLEVVEVLEGTVSTAVCVLHGGECPLAEKCPQKLVMHKISRDIREVLGKYKVRDIC